MGRDLAEHSECTQRGKTREFCAGLMAASKVAQRTP